MACPHPSSDESDNMDDETTQCSSSPYDLLELQSCATTEEIRRAYRRLALKFHPDKLPPSSTDASKLESKELFQKISTAYAVLSDPVRRMRYDTTGSLNESMMDLKDDDVSWDSYFREMWSGLVTEQSINDYKVKYRFSEEERRDVLAAYIKTKGALLGVIDSVPLSTLDDIDRYRIQIESAIESGEVEKFKNFPLINPRELAKRRAQDMREAKEVEKEAVSTAKKGKGKGRRKAADSSVGDEDALANMIMAKNSARMGSLISRLEEKYAPKPSKRKLKPFVAAASSEDGANSSSNVAAASENVASSSSSSVAASKSVDSKSKAAPSSGKRSRARKVAASDVAGVYDMDDTPSTFRVESTASSSSAADEPIVGADGSDCAVDTGTETRSNESSNSSTSTTHKATGNIIVAPSRDNIQYTESKQSKRSKRSKRRRK
ncbi:hypothetical protein BASA50_009005 [Batrachochytrium salamandrivorans]|uniref:J domain-containing protein n=1 Tax=Batrachochytrium salamandrivorans TaxID=1357716 RepID=A0ABQ8F2J9_9FUNG|nr:hypothetical protein BASA62_000069 [Batrachochytrium salamandrivorans]KAH6573052.1 hypothetical protein BASA60_006219 [Batrachochytrium salamandrivorans]KAH6578436.1 hypothetical protein BASA61_000194 [Batrachochytrium salamandrivorans]KAH6591004.1 hypothetical protein BASA50_009005 [Batrachochytrium salamandrivorans]KAH9277273.1 hypothetical protein BASA83_000140 [Batrachochytrium salamandrivorans]